MFPQTIHFIWIQGFESAPKNLKKGPVLWGDSNPGWETLVWDGNGLRELLVADYGHLVKTWDDLENRNPVMRADFGRLVLAHRFGGLYLDLDLIPRGSIDGFLGSGVTYNKTHRGRTLPDFPSLCVSEHMKYDVILSRENCNIDRIGAGVANGMILAKPENGLLMDFITQQRECHRGLILDFMGTWALTRFVRSRLSQLSGKWEVLPPHYFLWEKHSMNCGIPEYTVSSHPGVNTWGDHSMKQWWKV